MAKIYKNEFVIWKLDYWFLFVFWCLRFEISLFHHSVKHVLAGLPKKRLWFFVLSTCVLLICFPQNNLFAQFPWPVTPFDQSHEITGNFSEFRDTGSSDHFHNGTDIPKPDGSPVYPVKDGVVTALSRSGSSAYVRVQDIAYVHINPRPSLSVGDSVFTSQSVLGTIIPGLGHVHFTNGFVGSERNSMLPNGLSPLEDKWAPIIRYIRFYRNLSFDQFPDDKVSDLVDIIVKVDEQNGPPAASLSRRNNGTYKIGYKILSADRSTIVYSPPNGGNRFQFDTKPNNSYVHNVFSDQLSSTTSHVYIVTNNLTGDNFWNTTTLPKGEYTVMAFAEDTFGNADTLYSRVEVSETDNVPPEQPLIKFVGSDSQQLQVRWYPNEDPDLLGYRLFFSFDNVSWQQRLNESRLTKTKVDTSFNVSLNRDIYFRLHSVDNAVFQNVSIQSDVYGSSNVKPEFKILIVDGFDRTEASGSWHQPWHDFALLYGKAIAENDFGFETAANDAILDSSIVLEDYDAVMWLLGDESFVDETFDSVEQNILKSYLEQGGNLFVSGSEIAWDLDRDGNTGSTIADEKFLNDYLKIDFAGNNADLLAVTGVQGTIFTGLEFGFGANPYEEDSPDFITPVGNNSIANLKYNSDKIAAIQFEGVFGAGIKPAKLIYFGFPFETITSEDNRNEVMKRILRFFFPTTLVENQEGMPPTGFALFQNYPNPFNPNTTISYRLPKPSRVTISVLNTLGQNIRTLVDERKSAGRFTITWDGLNNQSLPVTSGLYLIQMHASGLGKDLNYTFKKNIRMTLLR